MGKDRVNMNKMMQQVQQMQAEVAVKASGAGDVTEIKIAAEAIDPDDPEMLEDLVLAAVNEALRSSQELQQSKLGGAMGGLEGLSLPGF